MKCKTKRGLTLVAVLGAMVLLYIFAPEVLVGMVRISIAGIWLILALIKALKGGIKMSVVLHLFEWFIVGLLFYFVIRGWKRGSKAPKGSIKGWAHHVCNPISLGAPAGLFAITLLLGLLGWSGLDFWIVKWTLLLAFIYASGRYHIESCYWPSENESLALVNNWRGELGGTKLEKRFQYLPALVFKVLRVRCNKIRKEFFLGAITGGAKTGKFLNRTLVAKVRVVLKFKLVDLSKAIGDYEVSESKDIAKEAIEALDQEVKDIFLTTFLETFRGYAYEKSLDKRKELCEKVVKALKEPLEALGMEIEKDWVSLPAEIEVDGRFYDCLNRMSLTDFETKEVFRRAEIGKKMGFELQKIKGIKSDIKRFVFADRLMKSPESLSMPETEEKTVVKEEKLRISTVREPFKLFLIWALLGLIILLGVIPLGFIGYSKFGPAKAETSIESVVPAGSVAPPANPSGPSGTVDSPFSQYHIPGFTENPLLWGAVAVLVAFLVFAGITKFSNRNSEWISKYGKWIFRGCGAMIFFGMLMQPYAGLMGSGALILVIGLFIYIGARKNRMAKAVDGMIGLILFYIIVLQLFIPMSELVTKINQPRLYKLYEKQIKEPIESGKAWEDFKKLFSEPQSQVSNETFGVPSQPTVEPKVETPKKVVEFQPSAKVEKPKVIESPEFLVPKKITIPVLSYVDGDWDEYGVGWNYARESSDEIWGRKVGYISYAFRLDKVGDYVLSVRLSSELENTTSSYKRDSSDVTLVVNGIDIGTKNVIADDASGRVYSWQIPVSCLKVGENTISFVVNENGYRNGLVIYTRYPIRLEPV